MRIALITPPNSIVTGPVSAAAVLAGHLRGRGHDAVAFDVGRFCVDRLIRRQEVIRALARLPVPPGPAAAAYWRVLSDSVNSSVADIRSGAAFADVQTYRKAGQFDVESAMDLHARVFGRSRWSSVDYRGNHRVEDPADLLAAVIRGGELFDEPIDRAVEAIDGFQPGLVAVSLMFPQQLYGGLRLAYRVKQLLPYTRVVIGGPTVTKLRAAFRMLPRLSEVVHYIIFREGERPLSQLVEAMEGTGPAVVPGLFPIGDTGGCGSSAIAPVSIGVRRSRTQPPGRAHDLRTVPPPEFEDLVPGPYLSPELVLPVSTTRGCYYNLCEFCSIGRSFDDGYREMTAAQMVGQMAALSRRHDTRLFKDVSEAIPPRLMHGFCNELIDGGHNFSWEAYLRFESPFDDDAAITKFRQAGLTVAYLGLESGSQNLCNTMKKAIEIGTSESIIRRLADHGVWVHLFLMAGHPGEIEADHDATLEFLRRNKGYVHSIQAAGFQMELDSDIVGLGDKYGFTVRPRTEPSFSTRVELDRLGTVPDDETIARRVSEIHGIAFKEGGDTLAASRQVWDGHKIIFADRAGGPRLPFPGICPVSGGPPARNPDIASTRN